MLPALIILALWVALLAPGVVKWIRHHQRATSIASFHRQLRLLEHSGPNLIEPAYRLGGQDELVAERDAPRVPAAAPRLVLVHSSHKESTMRYDDRHDGRYEEPYAEPLEAPEAWDDPWQRDVDHHEPVARSRRTVRVPYEYEDEEPEGFTVLSADHARVRRTRIIAGLAIAIAGSFFVGLVSGLTVLWAVTVVALVALGGFLALMYYASSTGMYGQRSDADLTPVARAVMPVGTGYAEDYDDDWESDRFAVAR
ncbi:MAG TPA: hypothetical protein VMQ40_01275 [Acidimicrobiales bacterium]|nr:hypothetical protein [Acidimicrobiales bacterium]